MEHEGYIILIEEKPRPVLSETARRRRRIIERVNYLLAALGGIGIYVLTGLALRWLGVA